MGKAAVIVTGESAVREAITVRGLELLALIAASGFLMLTQDEGADIVAAGDAAVDPAIDMDGDLAGVRLTPAGEAKLAPAPVSAGYAVDKGVAIPSDVAKRGRSGGYPFATLEVGDSFHIAPDDDETPEDVVTRLQSSVSAARAKFGVGTGVFEDFVKKTYKRNAEGKGFEKDAEGKRVLESEVTESREVMKTVRDFKAGEVGASDPRGAGARVWRTA